MTRRHTTIPTAIGDLLLLAEGDDLTGLYFPEHWYPPAASALGEAVDVVTDSLFERASEQLVEYLAGERTEFELLLSAAGGDFEQRVWAELRSIPYGHTTTYGAIARTLGGPALARRVGYSVGHNPLSIVVPCHRVLGADGRLTGYAGGVDRKQALLELEGALLPLDSLPQP